MADRASAAVFSALARKQSLLREPSIYPELIGLTENFRDFKNNNSWIKGPIYSAIIRVSAILSLLSVCINTPVTLTHYPFLTYLTFGVDIFCSLIFTIELFQKLSEKNPTLCWKNKWTRFDLVMVICLWSSLILQMVEIMKIVKFGKPWSILRCPRPLIIIRLFSPLLKFQLPKNRINQIFKRSSQQVYNVTLFFLFFMSLYAMNGVQFFGKIKHHCVTNDTQPDSVITINSFSIPHSYCSPNPNFGYHCPRGMKCMELNLPYGLGGFDGFNNFFNSFFTVYESGSQEGWAFIMYKMIDSLPAWRAILYFVSLIFFLAWLVKNVFIAVITETFAEIRVQFQQMWGFRASNQYTTVDHHIVIVNNQWKLVKNGMEQNSGYAPHIFKIVLHTPYFNIGIILFIIIDAIIAAGILDKTYLFRQHKNKYLAQVVFTLIFDIEAIYKIWCIGITGYFKRSIFKFEFILALGSTIHILPIFYHTQFFTVFQVLRIVRLIKASPMLENFVNKIFGPGKKLGSLILFTVCLLIIASSISLQLFCYLDLKQFSTFPYAFMSMFQILTQEGWVELLDEILWSIGSTFAPLVAIYFTFYHLFVTLIVLSLFVAVILDNLELEEDIKKMKQLKLSEQTAGKEAQLPWRLRIFDKFSPHPQLIKLHRMTSDFSLPKIRESFLRKFMIDNSEISILLNPVKGLFVKCNQASTKTIQIDMNIKRKEEKLLGEDIFKITSNEQKEQDDIFLPYKRFNKPAFQTVMDANINRPFYDQDSNTVSLRDPSILDAFIKKYEDMRNTIIKFNSPMKELYRDGPSDQSSQLNQSFYNRGSRSKYPRIGTFKDKKEKNLRKNTLHLKQRKYRSDEKAGLETNKLNRDEANAKSKISLGTGEDRNFDIKAFQHKKQQAEMKRNLKEDELRENHPFFDSPLFIIGRDSMIRKKIITRLVYARFDYSPKDLLSKFSLKCLNTSFCERIFNLIGMVTYLDWIMILFTSLSCISLMMETSEKRIMNTYFLKINDYVFIMAMSVELLLKITCNGLIFTPNAYLKDFGGLLDLFIYMVNVCFLIWMPTSVPQASLAQMLMVFRAFRPLRIFVLLPHIRKVIKELFRGFKEITLVSILLIVSLFIFSSYGVQLYAGKLARCNDQSIKLKVECKGIFLKEIFVTKLRFPDKSQNIHPKIMVPRIWANPRNFNFDNVQNAMLALFEILSFKGWTDIRDMLIIQVGPLHAIYVHIFVFVACMIGLTLFVGVVIANYMENKGTALLTVDQRRWCDLKARLKIAQPLFLPPKPSSCFGSRLYDITQSKYFKRIFVYLIIFQSSLLSVKWNKDSKYSLYLAIISSVFIFLFVIEIMIKIGAFSINGYWQSKRNRYDFIITLISVIWIFLFFGFNTDTFYYMGYFVIILRFFSLVGKHPILQMLMLTVVMTFFKSFFIIMAMFLLIISYALIGVILFGTVKYGENLGRQANFKTAPRAMLVLFRIVTGEDWNKILHDTMIQPPYCTPAKNYWHTDCGNPTAALFYFCSFYVIITYIVLNLLVAIIMENFSLFYSNEEDALISHTDIRNFQMIWNIVDINQKGDISKWKVKFLLRLLKGRLQVDLEKEKTLFQHMCYEIEKMNTLEEVSFHDVLNVLAYRSVDIQKSLQIEELLEREELEFLIREEVAKQTIRKWLEKCLMKKRSKNKTDLLTSMRATQESILLENLHKLDIGPSNKLQDQIQDYYLSNKNDIFLNTNPIVSSLMNPSAFSLECPYFQILDKSKNSSDINFNKTRITTACFINEISTPNYSQKLIDYFLIVHSEPKSSIEKITNLNFFANTQM
ncbi:unnamed protein product [Gordionus sp. m RMFG-2023]